MGAQNPAAQSSLFISTQACFFRALSQSHKHYLCASYFLLSPGVPTRCLGRQRSPSEHEPLCQQEERSWEHAGCGSTDGQRFPAKDCVGAGAKFLLLHPRHHPYHHLPLSAGHSGGPSYLHRWEIKQNPELFSFFLHHRSHYRPATSQPSRALRFFFIPLHPLHPQRGAPASSSPTPDTKSITSWTLTVTMATTLDTGSEFTGF